jgi:hypothetical protein
VVLNSVDYMSKLANRNGFFIMFCDWGE